MKNKNNIILNLFIAIVLIFLLLILSVYLFEKSKYQDKNQNKFDLFIDQLSLKPNKYPRLMSNDEIILLIAELQNAKNYLEFGSGGSTYIALLNSKANVVSVESDPNWLNYMRKWRFIRQNEGKRLTFYYSNIGKIAGSGYPESGEGQIVYPDYSKKVFKYYPRDYDVVLIDGRFRLACALQTLLHTRQDVIILWHDFPYRPYYHEILDFVNVLEAIDTMVVLTKKPDFDKEKVKNLYEKYKYDVR